MRRLRKPKRRTAHIAWLVIAASVALVFTRGAMIVLFMGLFFVLWLLGYGVLARLYR
jgi:hypothetical protein